MAASPVEVHVFLRYSHTFRISTAAAAMCCKRAGCFCAVLLQLRVALQHVGDENRGMTSFDREPIHVTALGEPHDPRSPRPDIPGVVVHYVPELHPDDLTVLDGIPVTTPSRTLIDLGEVMDKDELRATFARALLLGLLDTEALEASYARVEWRPSLQMVREVMDEFAG
ncbi:MAG TPA: hypothetical protein VGO80_20345 [Solirubrobacteraceae bacterium]|nr:hypothetical protein [Solirubrobacteraceae bacterium]